MKIKDRVFEIERKENGQEVVMRSKKGMRSLEEKNPGIRRGLEGKHLFSPLVLSSSNL